ncbi:Twitchin [Aphelenchoides besseyi]|nr:Twitchin [Aphelenchoides besseyi]KAI6235445.1 Twitchin [Aphelenchoides besseyi]
MAPPSIHGDPKITQDEKSGSVFLEVSVEGADPANTRWFLGDNELDATASYKFSHADDSDNRKKLICEIKNFDKSLAGTYKAVFSSGANEENYATFTVQSGNAPEFYDKPKIIQRDNGNVIAIKVRGKSATEAKAEWFKDDKPVVSSDRIKIVQKPDDKDKEGTQYLLEITGPKKEDEAKYKCRLVNSEGSNQQSLALCFD